MELNIGAIFISNKILKDKEPPAWMYREESENEGDSGWRVFSGNEDDNYLDNPDNFKLVSSEQLIAIDESIKANLLAPYGFSFEKNPETNDWEMVDDGE
ncbi:MULTISPECIES: DUF2185 domain-containing protein [Tenacibaculum]|uniref:DUF2185 domain-containing protein n=1 Tax=Tenacibaculum larymnensis TaxID=2878201 RepID=A0A9X4ETE7_9FLAO|nr:DUF2185 domain-containing protein [Tenacibaculum larymnensis]MDE1208460.1 DUF2185 domain-containing protein [Tenacibaculum larymnensis]